MHKRCPRAGRTVKFVSRPAPPPRTVFNSTVSFLTIPRARWVDERTLLLPLLRVVTGGGRDGRIAIWICRTSLTM